jgi:hypothetical protein
MRTKQTGAGVSSWSLRRFVGIPRALIPDAGVVGSRLTVRPPTDFLKARPVSPYPPWDVFGLLSAMLLSPGNFQSVICHSGEARALPPVDVANGPIASQVERFRFNWMAVFIEKK